MPLGNFSHKKVTLSEIARASSVSKSTASLVLNDSPNAIRISHETRRRVIDTARRMGYMPNAAAKALATGRSNTILIVAFDLWDENIVERLRGAEAHLVPRGYSTRMCTIDPSAGLSSYSEMIRTGQADGVLLSGHTTADTYPILRDLQKEAESVGVPVVAMADAFPKGVVEVVAAIDEEGGAFDAVTHLLEHGHKRIFFLGVADQPWAGRREAGYIAALKNAGIPIDPNLMRSGPRNQTFAFETTQELVKDMDFTAMFIVTDNMAMAAMAALHNAGKRIPEDCAIIGFNNKERIARYTIPALTTVNNPFYECGKSAAVMVLDMIEKKPMIPVTLPVSLVIRRSCGCKG